MIALDTSVLAYAVNRYAPEHTRAAQVVDRLANGDHPWALPWSVVHEFLRLVTHPHAAVRSLRPSDAWAFAGELIASPTVRLLAPTDRHSNVLVEVLGMAAEPTSLAAGLETAVLLREHGIRELLSAGRGMRRFSFLTVRDPVHGEAWTPGERPARRYRKLSAKRTGAT